MGAELTGLGLGALGDGPGMGQRQCYSAVASVSTLVDSPDSVNHSVGWVS